MNALLIKAFSDNPGDGNPAGVIFSDQALPEIEMKNIAQKLGFSESAFICKSTQPNYQYSVRYFTRGRVEVPLCGHATIALAKAIDDQSDFETITISTLSGLITLKKIGDEYYLSTIPRMIGEIEFGKDEVAILFGLTQSDIQDFPIVSASVGGKPKLMVPVKSLQLMQTIVPDLEKMIGFCKANDIHGFYPFSQETVHRENSFHARQFNPAAGIDEDPQTGVAAGALAIYSQYFQITDRNTFSIEQGFEMGMPGIIKVLVKENYIMIGGHATVFGAREIS